MFSLKKGLRQEEELFPTLFSLALESKIDILDNVTNLKIAAGR